MAKSSGLDLRSMAFRNHVVRDVPTNCFSEPTGALVSVLRQALNVTYKFLDSRNILVPA